MEYLLGVSGGTEYDTGQNPGKKKGGNFEGSPLGELLCTDGISEIGSSNGMPDGNVDENIEGYLLGE